MNHQTKFFGPLSWMLLFTAPAYGLTMEYYTWNAYPVLEQALLQVSLIFSDARYHELFGIVILAAVLFAAISGIFKALGSGGKAGAWVGLWPILAGTVLYLGVVVPKGEIQLHDQVLNKTRLFGGIPEGLVLVMGVFNLVERWGIDLIETTQVNPDMRYSKGTGGIGFKMLATIAGGDVLKADDRLADASLGRYLDDCLLFEVARPGTTVNVNTIHKTDNWISVLDLAVNPTVYTTNYMTDSAGAQVTCTESWTLSLRGYFNNGGNMETMRKSVCADAGLNPADPQQYLACQDIIDSSLRISAGKNSPGVASTDYIRQAYMAQAFDRVLSSGPDAAIVTNANRNVMSQGLSTLLVANEYVPIIRGMITYMVILAVPFLVILMATPAFGKVVSTITGFFVFLTFWGIFDCALHVGAMIQATSYFESVALNNTGYAAIMMTPDAAGKALGVFGMARPMAIGFATLCAAVAGFQTNSVIASFANQAMQPVSQGAAQGASLSTPEGHGRALSELEQSFGQTTYANNPFEGRIAAQVGNKMDAYGTGMARAADPQKTFDQAGENVQIAQAVHNREREAAQANGQSLAGAKADLAGSVLNQNLQTKSQEDGIAREHGHQDRDSAQANLSARTMDDRLTMNEQEQKLAKQLHQGDASSMNAKQAIHEKEAAFGHKQADEKLAHLLGINNQSELAQWRHSGGVLNEEQAKHLGPWAHGGMSLKDPQVNAQGELVRGRMEDQVTADNQAHYQKLIKANAQAGGMSEEQADSLANRVQVGQMVGGHIGANGRGVWDLTDGEKIHSTHAGSDTFSDKHINQRSIEVGSQFGGIYNAALAGDKKTLGLAVDGLFSKDGKINEGRLLSLTDSMADQIEKTHQVSQGSSKSVGVGASASLGWGNQSGAQGAGASLLEGLGGAGVHGSADYNRSNTEHNDILRAQLFREGKELSDKYPDRAQFNEKAAEWMQKTAQGYQNRAESRADSSNGLGFKNLWDDGRESLPNLLGGKDKTDYHKED
ncbi:MAG: hypothetical protein A2600_14095 [Candidatus Lambdaproteobacteria bacterium RIFOXYD1_FULL_56_27]|uniref:TraG N-terminal Proteobacteria domain-containing protein n=1 Tax=Candidatus Lambdaproteobacteria bacterium RIFOXYD2_FULL_56_26 TaxID=1817773 RepID=A0A1F6H181_9PROT|nr:MAG: hypothetical protein A2557_14130 [Candidatus Lambdaproteobacteria bacterium RIFOXYD2_FULL_56_26]OGH08268.1 MAG: hypothetical protein A2600_14095 [Candidatus Lambdaproteobacteria bacterium RIFOXYD1_FULL_56_27]